MIIAANPARPDLRHYNPGLPQEDTKRSEEMGTERTGLGGNERNEKRTDRSENGERSERRQ